MAQKKSSDFIQRETHREQIERFCRDINVSTHNSQQLGWLALFACILNGEQRVDEALRVMGVFGYMKKREWELLFKLTCNEQDKLLKQGLWNTAQYKDLEHIKIRLKKKLKRDKGQVRIRILLRKQVIDKWNNM